MLTGRRVRIFLLVLFFGVSLTLLFNDPRKELVTEAEWRMVTVPAKPCLPAHPADVAWSLDAPTIVRQAALIAIGPRCWENCPANHSADVRVMWHSTPGFFSGYARVDVGVLLRRQIGSCVDEHRLALRAGIDQGRRGRPEVASRHIGRYVGEALRRNYLLQEESSTQGAEIN